MSLESPPPLDGKIFRWNRPPAPRFKGETLAELVLMSHGMSSPPPASLDPSDPMLLQAFETARFIRSLKPARAFINADYDVDGTSSAAILGGMLKKLGWDVRVFIPDRFEDSYGVNKGEIARAWDSEPFELLIAADCGATEMDWLSEFSISKKLAGTLVIDHHKKTPHKPGLVHELNPQNHLSHGIHEYGYCTAVLCALVAEHVWKEMPEIPLKKFKILAGAAALADVTSMRCPTARHYASEFLTSRPGECEPLDALAEVAKVSRPLESTDALFKIIPMLNAAGRMRNATVLVALWDCDDYQECLRVANRLWSLNRDRRRLQEDVVRRAASTWKQGDRFILAWDESWHPGVVGPAAGQLVERYNIPVFLGGYMPQKGCYSFSGRSPEGVDIHALLSAAAKNLPVQFGGHKVALGMRVKKEDVPVLATLKEKMIPAAPVAQKPVRNLSGILKLSSVNFVNYESLRTLEPFGSEFPSPVFCVANVELSLSPMANIADSSTGVARSQDGHTVPVVVFRSPALAGMRTARGHLVGEMLCGRTASEKTVKLLVKDFIPHKTT
jgi:single-stranded-DNA-specific exonuclease